MLHGDQNCIICGSSDIVFKTEDVNIEYKNQNQIVYDYRTTHCNECGEDIVETESLKRYDKIFIALKRKSEGLLTPCEIREIRTSIELTQDQAGNILGGGPKAFAKYENGKIPQAKAMDNLLRIIRDYPIVIKSLLHDDHNNHVSQKMLISEEANKYSDSSKNTIPFGEPHYKSFSEGEQVWKLNLTALS